MRVALMKEYRLANLCSNLQLCLKSALLRIAGREVAKIVQPAFSYGDNFGLPGQSQEGLLRRLAKFGGVVRVQTGSGEQAARVVAGQCDGLFARRHAGARDNHAPDTGGPRAIHYRIAIAVKTVVSQVGPDVDQIDIASTHPNCFQIRYAWRQAFYLTKGGACSEYLE